jgi:hypothetical protein
MTHGGRTDLTLVHSVDVGISYGFYAVAAALTYRFPARWRSLYTVALLTNLVVVAIASREFSDVGHLCAVLIGLASYPLVRSRMRRDDRLADNQRALTELTGAALSVQWNLWRRHVPAIWAGLLLVSAPVAGVGATLLTEDINALPGLVVVGITAASVAVIGFLDSQSLAH